MIKERAMDKVRDEMAKAPAGSAVSAVGEIVTDLLPQMPGLAKMVLEDGKTLKGAYEYMRQVAAKKKAGNCYGMPPGECMTVICEYYGIEAGEVRMPQPTVAAASPEAVPSGGDALDDLLEGL